MTAESDMIDDAVPVVAGSVDAGSVDAGSVDAGSVDALAAEEASDSATASDQAPDETIDRTGDETPDEAGPEAASAAAYAANGDAAAEVPGEMTGEATDEAGDDAADDGANDGANDGAGDAPFDPEALRLVEAILFAAVEPLDEASIAARLPEDSNVPALLAVLAEHYAARGVNLVRVAKKWALRTAPDLGGRLQIERETSRRLSRAAIETLSIVAYHQPITRAEIENIRGVAVNRGTLDVLLEADWIKPGRRREVPGRPVTWLTTEAFLDHFGLESLKDLPGVKELKAAGLLDTRPAINVYSERAQENEGDLDEDAAESAVEPLGDDDTPAAT